MKKINKKAQGSGIPALSVSMMIAIFIFLVGMSVVNLIKPEVTNARDPNNLDCNNDSISDGTKLTCLGVDLIIPYFIVLVCSAAGGAITYRLMI